MVCQKWVKKKLKPKYPLTAQEICSTKFLGKTVYQPYKSPSWEQEKRNSSKTHCLGLAQTQYKIWQGGDENGNHSTDVKLLSNI